jgi:hypothetical protein
LAWVKPPRCCSIRRSRTALRARWKNSPHSQELSRKTLIAGFPTLSQKALPVARAPWLRIATGRDPALHCPCLSVNCFQTPDSRDCLAGGRSEFHLGGGSLRAQSLGPRTVSVSSRVRWRPRLPPGGAQEALRSSPGDSRERAWGGSARVPSRGARACLLPCLEIDKLQGRALERRPQMSRAGFTVSEEPRHRKHRYTEATRNMPKRQS